MISKTNNPITILVVGMWFISIFFSGALCCQCPGNHFFNEKINAIYTSTSLKTESQLTELLQLQQQMKACRSQKDSSFMYLLQKIGSIYYKQSNYPAAIEFTNQSVNAAKECLRNHSCNELALVHNYYNLSLLNK